MLRPPSNATLTELKTIVGDGSWLDAPQDLAPYLVDFRKLYKGATPLVLLPRSVEDISRIMAVCHRDAVAVVPHGGNTSYCGGATPDESGSQIVVSLQRLNRVRHVDAANYSMIVEVGVTLAGAQGAARDAERLFPLSLGSEGTAQIGGNLSTNAGGTAVLRYGMMRDLVLGLEVVLADGQDRLRRQIAVHRRRGHARHHHRRIAQAVSPARRHRHGAGGHRHSATRLGFAGAFAQSRRRSGHHLRTDAAHRG
jgi:FAD/FMN-containing dehydrogenase